MIQTILKNKLFKIGGRYAGASIFTSFVTMATGIIMIKWLDPKELGLWQSLSVFQVYFPILEFGIPNGLNRELPFLMGQGKEEEAERHASAAYAYAKFLSFLSLVITIIISFILLLLDKPFTLVAGVFAVGCTISLTAIQRYLTVTFRSAQSFHKLSVVYLWNAFAVVCLFPLIYFFHYYGLLIFNVAILFIKFLQMYMVRPLKVKPQFNKESFKHLAVVGLPVYIMGYFRGIANSFSRLVLLSYGGIITVGIYAPVAAIGTAMNLFPTVFANLFFPQMTHRYGQTGDAKTLWPAVWKSCLILFVVNVPLVFAIWLGTPYLVNEFFPKYTSAIVAMQWISLTFLFSGGLVTHNTLYSIKAYRTATIYSIAEVLLYAIVPYSFVHWGGNQIIDQTAKAIVLVTFILFLLNFILLRQALFHPKFMIKKKA